jgi:SHS2 domain-containing protein
MDLLSDWIYFGDTTGFTESTMQIETLENHFANAAETYDQTTRQQAPHTLNPKAYTLNPKPGIPNSQS